MSLSHLQYYNDKVGRLVEEAIEVALVLCNSELREFSVAKIFDILNQILPTAFVIGTSYWPYYHSLHRQKLCVCGRYGLICRHIRSHDQHHFIDMDPIIPDDSLMFCLKRRIRVVVNQYHIDIEPFLTDQLSGFNISIKLTLKYTSSRVQREARNGNETFHDVNSMFPVSMFCRYNFQREYYPNIHTIHFEPNPFFFYSYGSVFPRLINIRPYVLSLINRNHHLNPATAQIFMTRLAQDMPGYTLVLQHVVNLPVFVNCPKVIAIPVRLDQSDNYQRPDVVHRGTQTLSQEELVAESYKQYRQRTSHLRHLWNPDCNHICYQENKGRSRATIQEASSTEELQGNTISTTDSNITSNNSSTFDDPRSIDSEPMAINEIILSPEPSGTNILEEPKRTKIKEEEDYIKHEENISKVTTVNENTASNSPTDRHNQSFASLKLFGESYFNQNWDYPKLEYQEYQIKSAKPSLPKHAEPPFTNEECYSAVYFKKHKKVLQKASKIQQSTKVTREEPRKVATKNNEPVRKNADFHAEQWPTILRSKKTHESLTTTNNAKPLRSYAQVTGCVCPATITSGALEREPEDFYKPASDWSAAGTARVTQRTKTSYGKRKDVMFSQTNVMCSPDSTINDVGYLMENQEYEWISPRTASDYVLMTAEDIDQHLNDMEDIISNDSAVEDNKDHFE